MKKRKELDSIGSIYVPGDKYWGASTERSKELLIELLSFFNANILRSITSFAILL